MDRGCVDVHGRLGAVRGLPPVVGFPAGPFVVAPSLIAGYSCDSNVLLAPDDQSPSPDSVTTLQPALNLTILFSNSAFRLGDTFRWVSYKKTPQRGQDRQ